MADIRNLLKRVAAEEEILRSSLFLAPCVRGGRVRAHVFGLIYTFEPRPHEFEGWGIFRPVNEREARLVERAGLERVAEYLRLFPGVRLRLGYRLQNSAWLAFAVNESDGRLRFASRSAEPVVLHMVTDGQEFEQVVARNLCGAWWFEELDRRASPLEAEGLREALRSRVAPAEIKLKGLTPEMRACYSLVFRREELERERRHGLEQRRVAGRDEARLRSALRFGGGDLRGFRDRGEFWLVEWLAHDGQLHTSAIAKNDLTVVSAGICLSGEDRKFDLQSLVGVAEGEW
ncbi:MAG: hypothetical protein ICV60_04115 [Pyrinomonadaceae bacterium]|nr:hypothetical protein [Pyrinomonadaceae bacterium]